MGDKVVTFALVELKAWLFKVCIRRLEHIYFEKSSSTVWQVRCCAHRTRRFCQKYDEDFFQILWPSQKTQTLSKTTQMSLEFFNLFHMGKKLPYLSGSGQNWPVYETLSVLFFILIDNLVVLMKANNIFQKCKSFSVSLVHSMARYLSHDQTMHQRNIEKLFWESEKLWQNNDWKQM